MADIDVVKSQVAQNPDRPQFLNSIGQVRYVFTKLVTKTSI